ncbi:ATP-grasp domain-containing protein [Kitasatospora purpeofusca]|uniref:hypothetical protein n=1 Tax=Kitasatospora purpeofusca TaxID=67352 RepID=UPI00382D3806
MTPVTDPGAPPSADRRCTPPSTGAPGRRPGADASRVDFRTDYDSLTYKVCDVPEGVADGVRSLMAVFGLRYAALDFLVDNDGTWFPVDLNPNGRFGFVPDLRDPIAKALANLLVEGVPR